MVEVRLFGGVGAVTVSGDPVDVGPAKCQLVLAALALEPGVAVPVSRLVGLVWGENPPRTAERTLQSYVARIRRGLGAEAIVRSGSAYRLDVAPDSVDVGRFERRLDEGDVAGALTEWTGIPLAGLEAPGLAPAVDRLTERWLAALETDLEDRAARDPASVIGTLTELTATHPYREGLWALLMTALYRADRQADALAAYRRARSVLVDELGVEPGPRLRELESLVLDQHQDLGGPAGPAEAPVDDPPPRADVVATLPRLGTRLVGREHLLAQVGAAFARSRLVTLTGPGGVGKTTLATATAQATPARRVCFVDLSVSSTDSQVARAVADALGASERSGVDVLAAAAAAIDRLGPSLLVLDNCEQVIDGAATVVTAVLDRCAEATVLVTTREPLELVDEHVVPVPPLDPDAAVALFLERVSAAGGTIDDDDQADVAALCRVLDGVPLAIELAAARTRTLRPAELLDRLEGDLRILDAPTRARPARHRTLRAAVEWSHDLLEPQERTVFERLSVFRGAFDLRAAEAVVADEDLSVVEVDDLLDRLVRQSMVAVQPAPGGMRFRLLAPMRELGAARLGGSDEDRHRVEVERRHTRWCLEEVREAGRLLQGQQEIRGAARLEELWADLRSAIDRASVAGDAGLVRALVEPVAAEIFLRSRNEIGEWAERVLELSDGDEDLVVFGLVWAARHHLRHRDLDGYQRLLRRFGAPDHPLVRHAGALVVEDHERLVGLCEEAASLLRSEGRDHLADLHEIGIARALLALGRLDEHDEVTSALVERFRIQGPPTFLHWSLAMLGYSRLRQRRREEADRLFVESAAVEVPPGTHSRSSPVAVGTAMRAGEQRRAFELLRDHAAALLERRDLYEARLLCLDVVNLLVAAQRTDDAAHLLGYLEASGLLDNPAFAAIVRDSADAVERTVTDQAARRSAGRRLDDAAALDLVHSLADELARTAPRR